MSTDEFAGASGNAPHLVILGAGTTIATARFQGGVKGKFIIQCYQNNKTV